MILRFNLLIILFTIFLPITSYGSAPSGMPADQLAEASSKMLKNDFRGALDSAISSSDSGKRDFLVGMASIRLEEWERAAEFLGKASTGFPLLADYALYYRAYALFKLGSYPDTLTIVQQAIKIYPESPLIRSVEKLQADCLYDSGNFKLAKIYYESFMGKYPSGDDFLEALYRSAKCRELTGESTAAVNMLKSILLNYPISTIAENAGEDLQRLTGKIPITSLFTYEELMRRGSVFYDRGKYEKAEETFIAIPQERVSDDLNCRLQMKIGQSRFRGRKFRGAENAFRALLSKYPDGAIADEARYWLAKTMDKIGNEDEALAIYNKLAEASPGSSLADDALLAAYFIRKFQNRGSDALTILKKLESDYPRSPLIQTAFWEIAWQSYQGGDYKIASAYFKRLLNDRNRREKSLYWYSRSLRAAGEIIDAEKAIATLVSEFPFGYYTLTYGKDLSLQSTQVFSPEEMAKEIPTESTGFDRAKVLIDMGLYPEARRELAWTRRRTAENATVVAGLARLYLKMGDFNRSSALIDTDKLHKPGRKGITEWGIAYPLAFSENVSGNAAEFTISESIIYSIMRAESNYSPSARSPAGALGLMQVMPATAAAIAKSGGEHGIREQLTRPEINISLGVRHLHDLLNLYGGDLVLAVAAYNAGAGNVNRWLKKFGNLPKDLFIENIPFAETREYVKKVLACAEIYNKLYRTGPPMNRGVGKTVPIPKDSPVKVPPSKKVKGIS